MRKTGMIDNFIIWDIYYNKYISHLFNIYYSYILFTGNQDYNYYLEP